MVWLVVIFVTLGVSAAIGVHLARFHDAYTEMLGMMAGMTMGMLNGFALGYAAAAATNSMFWGNLFGIAFGLILGICFGRPGGLMGAMDGAMGGVMGGSMGAMLAAMLFFPGWALTWTGVLVAGLYLLGMAGLVVLIERAAPDQVAEHRLAPLLARWIPQADTAADETASAPGGALVNYYELFDIPVRAALPVIARAYATRVAGADAAGRAQADQALATLSDPAARAAYDRALAVASGLDACCPPPRRSTPRTSTPAAAAPASHTIAARPAGPARPRPNAAARGPRRPAPGGSRARLAPVGSARRWGLALGTVGVVVALGIALNQATPSVGAGYRPPAAAAAPADPALLARATPATLANGVQTLDVVVNGNTFQYEPAVIRLKVGVPARFNLRAVGEPGCGRPVIIPALGAQGVVVPGQVSTLTFTPQQTGQFQMTCPMHMFGPGTILVTE